MSSTSRNEVVNAVIKYFNGNLDKWFTVEKLRNVSGLREINDRSIRQLLHTLRIKYPKKLTFISGRPIIYRLRKPITIEDYNETFRVNKVSKPTVNLVIETRMVLRYINNNLRKPITAKTLYYALKPKGPSIKTVAEMLRALRILLGKLEAIEIRTSEKETIVHIFKVPLSSDCLDYYRGISGFSATRIMDLRKQYFPNFFTEKEKTHKVKPGTYDSPSDEHIINLTANAMFSKCKTGKRWSTIDKTDQKMFLMVTRGMLNRGLDPDELLDFVDFIMQEKSH